eukprot:1160702-Pelagomonas_calceolata.AAC.1
MKACSTRMCKQRMLEESTFQKSPAQSQDAESKGSFEHRDTADKGMIAYPAGWLCKWEDLHARYSMQVPATASLYLKLWMSRVELKGESHCKPVFLCAPATVTPWRGFGVCVLMWDLRKSSSKALQVPANASLWRGLEICADVGCACKQQRDTTLVKTNVHAPCVGARQCKPVEGL